MLDTVNKELQGIIEKIDKGMKIHTAKPGANKLPGVSHTAKYSDRYSFDGDWTCSFWTGMVILAGVVNGKTYETEKKYVDYLDSLYDFYTDRIRKGWKDHDIGFLYTLYSVNAYRLTGDSKYMDLSIEAANALMCRYNDKGGFIRAWNLLIRPERREKLIIDCLMNLPLLFCMARTTGNKYMKEAAIRHAEATMNNIRPDGSTCHTFDFDYITGKPLKGENEGGYTDDSCWSRGQSWGVYGFTLAYMHTMDKKFLDAAIKVSDFFIAQLDDSGVPKWDFRLGDNPLSPEKVDTSAGAIAASGLYDLALCVEETDKAKAETYRAAADKILLGLIKNHSHVFDNDSEALLDSAYCGGTDENGGRIVHQWAAIFGDYYYMEALVKRSGLNVNMWDL
ncbi:MAG: glycoside hydrolase family 88 protein [Oscillospiraceae bacterium]|nr:glycoside hydrolase family 88 protein [Oscillospiraceae bacterium]